MAHNYAVSCRVGELYTQPRARAVTGTLRFYAALIKSLRREVSDQTLYIIWVTNRLLMSMPIWYPWSVKSLRYVCPLPPTSLQSRCRPYLVTESSYKQFLTTKRYEYICSVVQNVGLVFFCWKRKTSAAHIRLHFIGCCTLVIHSTEIRNGNNWWLSSYSSAPVAITTR